MHLIVKAMLIIFGVIHLLPLPGVLGTSQLQRLYGLSFDDPNLIIMMRHRAILFALLAIFAMYCAFRPDLLWIGIAFGIVSAASFVWFAWSVGGYNPHIGRVVLADLIAVGCLVVAAISHALSGE